MKKVLINVEDRELRVAILEDDQLTELYIESLDNKTILNNIYKGRVEGVLPGLSAAFVNIGLERNAFLHFDDVRPDLRLKLIAEKQGEALEEVTPLPPESSEYQPSEEELAVVAQTAPEVAETSALGVVEPQPLSHKARRRRRGRRGGRRRFSLPGGQPPTQFASHQQGAAIGATGEATGHPETAPSPPAQQVQPTGGQPTARSDAQSSGKRAERRRSRNKKNRRPNGGQTHAHQSSQRAMWTPRPAPDAIPGTRAATNPFDVYTPYAQPKKQKQQNRKRGERKRSDSKPTSTNYLFGPTTLPPDIPLDKDSQEDFFGPPEPSHGMPGQSDEVSSPDDAAGNVKESTEGQKKRRSGRRTVRRRGPAEYTVRRKKSAEAQEESPVAQSRTAKKTTSRRAQKSTKATAKTSEAKSTTTEKKTKRRTDAATEKSAKSEEKSAAPVRTTRRRKNAALAPAVELEQAREQSRVEETVGASVSAAVPLPGDSTLEASPAPKSGAKKRTRKKAVMPTDEQVGGVEAATLDQAPSAVAGPADGVEVQEKPRRRAAGGRRSARRRSSPATETVGESIEQPSAPVTTPSESELPESSVLVESPVEAGPPEVATPSAIVEEEPTPTVKEASQEPVAGVAPMAGETEQTTPSVVRRRSGRGRSGRSRDQRWNVAATEETSTAATEARTLEHQESRASAEMLVAPPDAARVVPVAEEPVVEPPAAPAPAQREAPRARRTPSVPEALHKGDEIMVQVIKEEIGLKGARISTYVSLPGRYLVLLPYAREEGGVSRRVENAEERKRLKRLLRQIREERRLKDMGFIVRTAGVERDEAEIRKDVDFLLNEWRKVQERERTSRAPALLYDDSDILYRLCRDVFDESIAEILIDSPREAENLKAVLGSMIPELVDRVKVFEGPENIFTHFQVDRMIEKARRRKVWLKSGGYIIIDEAEALTAIDVNTGKFVGKDDQEKMILKTNLEAARVIARELKLRDIGGLIVIDFIDMRDPRNRETLLNEFRSYLKKDHAKTAVANISEFGLVEMTRKRVRQSLRKTLFMDCPYCQGAGIVLNEQQIWIQIKYALMDKLRKYVPAPDLHVVVHPQVKAFIERASRDVIRRLEQKYASKISISEDKAMHIENFRLEVLLHPNSQPVAELQSSGSTVSCPNNAFDTNSEKLEMAPTDRVPLGTLSLPTPVSLSEENPYFAPMAHGPAGVSSDPSQKTGMPIRLDVAHGEDNGDSRANVFEPDKEPSNLSVQANKDGESEVRVPNVTESEHEPAPARRVDCDPNGSQTTSPET